MQPVNAVACWFKSNLTLAVPLCTLQHINNLNNFIGLSAYIMYNSIMYEDCMMFAGSKDHKGYARITVKIDGEWKIRGLHREMYLAYVGEIPEGLVLDHLCRVRCCINPEHLEPVTNSVNISRGNRPPVWTDYCNNGHKVEEGSYYVPPVGNRVCRQCRRDYLATRKDAIKVYNRKQYLKRKAEGKV